MEKHSHLLWCTLDTKSRQNLSIVTSSSCKNFPSMSLRTNQKWLLPRYSISFCWHPSVAVSNFWPVLIFHWLLWWTFYSGSLITWVARTNRNNAFLIKIVVDGLTIALFQIDVFMELFFEWPYQLEKGIIITWAVAFHSHTIAYLHYIAICRSMMTTWTTCLSASERELTDLSVPFDSSSHPCLFCRLTNYPQRTNSI